MSNNLRDELLAATATLERIGMDAMLPAVVLKVHAKTLSIASGDAQLVIAKDDKVSFKVGDSILIHHQQKAYIRHNEFKPRGSRISTVVAVLGDLAQIEMNGEKRLIPFSVEDLRVGDKVIMDASSSLIVEVLPRNKGEFSAADTGVSWDDIGGNHEAKEALIEAIEHPVKFAELFDFYGAAAASGILLLGPPGCGKTMLGKAAATALGSIEGFIYIKGPEVLNSYVGESEATIRSLFQRARSYKERTGRRAIIFIDEGDAILGDRSARHAMMEKTIVPMFLSEMDGLEDSAATIILSTNRPQALDPAVVREGRFNRKIAVTRPTEPDAVEIILTHLKKLPTSEDKAEMAASVIRNMFMATFEHQGQSKLLSNYISGAIIAGVVEKAKQSAMRRDIASNTRTGVTLEDMDAGLALTIKELGNAALEQA